jgi:rhodanese-related sulfurtransferase
MSQPITQISVEELAQLLSSYSLGKLQLLDVREPDEVAIAHIEGFEILPLSQFADWADSISARFYPNLETLVMCHHGIRSAQMCQWLSRQGFTNVKNVATASVHPEPGSNSPCCMSLFSSSGSETNFRCFGNLMFALSLCSKT